MPAGRTRPLPLVPVTATRERQSGAPLPASDPPPWTERSAFGTTRGFPVWGAVVMAALPTIVGMLLDILMSNKPGLLFTACYFVGCVLAVALVQRGSLFGAMVQPPLVVAITLPVVVLLVGRGVPSNGGIAGKALAVGSPLINSFPVMAAASIATLLVGLLRMFVLQRADTDHDLNPGGAPTKAQPSRARKPAAPAAGRKPQERSGKTPGSPGRGPAQQGARPDQRSADRPRGRTAGEPPRQGQAQPGRSAPPDAGRARRGQAPSGGPGDGGGSQRRGGPVGGPERGGGQPLPPGRGGPRRAPGRGQGPEPQRGGEPPRRPRPRDDRFE